MSKNIPPSDRARLITRPEDVFVGRQDLLDGFQAYASAGAGTHPPVICYHGDGGQGKSALLRHLYQWCKSEGIPSVHLDFNKNGDGKRLTDSEEGLLALASGVAASGVGCFCRRFLLVRGLLEARRTGRKWEAPAGALAQYGGAILELALAIANSATLGIGAAAASVVWRFVKGPLLDRSLRTWWDQAVQSKGWQGRKPSALEEGELVNLLPEALAADFTALHSRRQRGRPERRRPVVFLDTYEDLQQSTTRWENEWGHERGDGFIRELAVGTDAVLLVIGGRDDLDWGQESSPDACVSNPGDALNTVFGDRSLLSVPLADLPADECRSYLRQRFGMQSELLSSDLVDGLIAFTKGFPLHLGLAADVIAESLEERNQPMGFQDFNAAVVGRGRLPRRLRDRLRRHLPPQSWDLLEMQGDRSLLNRLITEIILERLLREVPSDERELIERASIPRYVTEGTLQAAAGIGSRSGKRLLLSLLQYSFIDRHEQPSGEPRWMIHSRVREQVLKSLDGDAWVKDAHKRLADYFREQSGKATAPETRADLQIEAVHHAVQAEEKTGIELFTETAEEFSRFALRGRLRVLVGGMSDQRLLQTESKLWVDYHRARICRSESRPDAAERLYWRVAQTAGEPRLRAYALSAFAETVSYRERGRSQQRLIEAETAARDSLQLGVPIDGRLARSYATLSRLCGLRQDWGKAQEWAAKHLATCERSSDWMGVVDACRALMLVRALRGDWPGLLAAHERAKTALPPSASGSYLEATVLADWGYARLFAGRYREVELSMEAARPAFLRAGGDQIRILALAAAHQRRSELTARLLAEDRGHADKRAMEPAEKATMDRLHAIALLRVGQPALARHQLVKLLSAYRASMRRDAIGESVAWLGLACETEGQCSEALLHYLDALSPEHRGRLYLECLALTGLVRTMNALGELDDIPGHLAEAEALAQRYQYNDHLASLRLSQGHLAWDGLLPEGDCGIETALGHYKEALVYALRYNRFMVDEVLWGGGVCTPLTPIIPHCQGRGMGGRQMLEALRDWWQSTDSLFGSPGEDSISAIRNMLGQSLAQSETEARRIEPGDGSEQTSVAEKLTDAIGRMTQRPAHP